MDKVYRKFYNNFHNNTNGFIPTQPLNRNIYPGDFFQIKNGELLVLGNIFRENIVNTDDVNFDNGIKLNPSNWNFSQGVAKSYSGRDSGHDPLKGNFEFSKQLLAFDEFGSFIFKTSGVESIKITNWSDFQQALIIKMTQTFHSFREVYIVTESATADHWTLAIAGAEKAELELANASENLGLIDIFGDANTKTIQAREIEFYHHENKRKPVFFKAKKLVVKQDKIEAFIGQLATEQSLFSSWADSFYDYNFHHDEFSSLPQILANMQSTVIDMLQGNQLNPNTALEYFSWTETNLDDVEKLFEGNRF